MLFPADTLKQAEPTLPLQISLNNVDDELFGYLVSAVYGQHVKIKPKRVSECVALSKRYQVLALEDLCVDYLKKGLSVQNACDMLQTSGTSDRLFVLKFIAREAEEILKTDSFLEISVNDLILILKDDHLSCDEIDLFSAVLRWGEEQMKKQKDTSLTLKKVLDPILKYIRFPCMTMEQLAGVVTSSGLLEQTDMVDLFTYTAGNKSTKLRFPTKERSGTTNPKNLKWDPSKSVNVTISSDGLTITPQVSGCAKGKFSVATEGFKTGIHYWEIVMGHTGGCYDAIGVTDEKVWNNARLGENAKSWAVRVYGNHSSKEHKGTAHNNQFNDFFQGWVLNDRIGLLYNATKGTLTYYRNGTKLGTPFTNVKGHIFPAVEICHHGSMRADFAAKLPKDK